MTADCSAAASEIMRRDPLPSGAMSISIPRIASVKTIAGHVDVSAQMLGGTFVPPLYLIDEMPRLSFGFAPASQRRGPSYRERQRRARGGIQTRKRGAVMATHAPAVDAVIPRELNHRIDVELTRALMSPERGRTHKPRRARRPSYRARQRQHQLEAA